MSGTEKAGLKAINATENSLASDWKNWDNCKVAAWISSLKLQNDYSQTIKNFHLTGGSLINLCPEYLDFLHINNLEDKLKILNSLSDLIVLKIDLLYKKVIVEIQEKGI
ncbi:hypothetical protein MHBO_000904 [Bonamia ostreae]|uniref:SAM domain-containing protein n=1 Tax=Bonamia ostreae TaxID=126728 RepID=A0ABV2AH70_9EUKA